MSCIELTEAFLARVAGWEAVKQARGLLAADRVLSSNWTSPVLKGVVQEGSITYRAGLVIKDAIDLENLCRCRTSRQWGTICAHSVAVGLHFLRPARPPSSKPELPGGGALTTRKPASPPTETRPAAGPLLRRAAGEDTGEPLELSVILPPNLVQAVAKGRVMVCFEGHWRQGRSPLNGLPLTTAFRLSGPDARLLDWIESQAGGSTPALLILPTDQLSGLFACLVGHPRITFGKQASVTVAETPWRIPLEAMLEPSGEIVLQLAPSRSELVLLGGPPSTNPILGERRNPASDSEEDGPVGLVPAVAWVLHGSMVQPLRLPAAYAPVLRQSLRLSRDQVPGFLSRDWPELQAACELKANFDPGDFVLEPKPPRFILALAGDLAQLQARLQCAYGSRILTLGLSDQTESFWLPEPEQPTRYAARDPASEQAALDRLRHAGFYGPDVTGRYRLAGESRVLAFFARDYPRLERDWEVSLESGLERTTSQKLERIEPEFQVRASGEQWFDLEISFRTRDGQRFSAAEIQRLILGGQGHMRLGDGRRALADAGALEELNEVLRDCAPEQHDGQYRLDNAQAGFLTASLQDLGGWRIQAPVDWQNRVSSVQGQVQLPTIPWGDLEAVLRPYQKQGAAWLHFLRQNHFGGILADEMGLGKTLQTLAFLQTGGGQAGAGPALIVCPTSLVFNWVAEAGKFTPRLRVLALTGPNRHEDFKRIPDHDLVITSYALIRRDLDQSRGLEFEVAVLDEAQHIENRQTQNAAAVKAVRARQRLVLTGTPLENSVLDLWSMFDFLMPGYLGTAADFRARYEVPITRDRDGAVQSRLARRVRPFMLRRLKREVAPELPAKLEQVSYCDLTDDQAAVYREILEAGRREVNQAVAAQGLARSRVVVLNALLRLRQVCCDLRLLGLEHVDPATASGKLDLCSELLDEALDGGHRVLVFSQFVRMLAILREKLKEQAIDFCYLDGNTTDRASVVERFQKDDEVPVFLISLKAGGLGLNLTGADTVSHYDPWWNPAAEDQATDRTHRIGQTRVVTSYRLITRGTVEEKILHLQNKKREIIRGLIEGDEAFVETLTWEEIRELLGHE